MSTEDKSTTFDIDVDMARHIESSLRPALAGGAK